METQIISYYNQLAKDYDSDRFDNSYGKFIDKQERQILTQILTNPNEQILDLACGTGRLLNFASIGIDASSEMLNIAKEKFPDRVFFHAEADHTGLDSNSVDTIIIFHLFMHLDELKIDNILAECSRILTKNGRVIFDIPSQKRRNLLNYKSNEWHGAYSSTIKKLQLNKDFVIKKHYGILFLPIHRFPKILRPFFTKIDSLLANSIFAEYSSYLIIEYRKNEQH